MTLLRKDRVEFYLLMIGLIGAGWILGLFGAIPALLIVLFLLWRSERFDDLLLGFMFMLVLSDTLQDQFPSLEFAKQLKNFFILGLGGILIVERERFLPWNPFIRKFLPFFVMAVIALLWAPPEVLFTSVQKTLSYFLLFLIVPNYVSYCYKRDGAAFFKRLVAFVIFVITLCIILKFLVPAAGVSHQGRMRGIFGNPNGLGIFIILATVCITVFRKLYPQVFSRAMLLFGYFVIILATYWSGSRTALLGVVIFLVFYQVFKFSPVLGFIGFLAVMLYINQLLDLTLDVIVAMGLGESLRLETLQEGSGRFIAWEFAWRNIQEHFYTGRGFGFDEHLMRSNFDFLSRQGHEGGVHNTYLILWLNTGIIGLLMYLRAFFLNFISAGRLHSLAFPVMFTIMFSIMFEPWLAASLNPYTSVFLAILVAISQYEFVTDIEEQEEQEKLEAEADGDLEKQVVPV